MVSPLGGVYLDNQEGGYVYYIDFLTRRLQGDWTNTGHFAVSSNATVNGSLTVLGNLTVLGSTETVVTGKVTTATYGSRFFWDTGTNVSLTASLTAGQVINYALLRNTNATSITATGEVGWKWTGGSMTNTVPAGCGMTFGWSCNPVFGSTNAYATAASVD